MSKVVIHIGAPRTGTTVLQTHLFKLARKKLVYSKRPFSATGVESKTKPGAVIVDTAMITNYLDSIPDDHQYIDTTNFANIALFSSCLGCSTGRNLKSDKFSKANYSLLLRSTQLMLKASYVANKGILISSERLCSTDAAMIGESEITNLSVKIPPYETLSTAFSTVAAEKVTISVCLRDPIPFIRSRYLRTFMNRKNMKLPALTVRNYIHNQITLEQSTAGASALAPALHKSFVRQLKTIGNVECFGFQNLLNSEDVFKTMGILGEKSYKFQDFPRENKVPFSAEQQQSVEDEVIQSLKAENFLGEIKDNQLYI